MSQARFDEIAGTEEVAKYVEKAEKLELDEDLREYFGDNCARLFWVNGSSGDSRNEMLEERTELFEKLMKSPKLSEKKKREVLELGLERKIPAAMCWKGKELEQKGKMKEALDMFVRSVQIGGKSVPYAMTKVAHACWSQSNELWSYDLPKTLIGTWRDWPEETKKMQRYDDLVIADNDVELCRRMGIPVIPDLENFRALFGSPTEMIRFASSPFLQFSGWIRPSESKTDWDGDCQLNIWWLRCSKIVSVVINCDGRFGRK